MVTIADSLARTESGGNYKAHRKNVDGREFTGKYQFGVARLKDLGLGQFFTYEEFQNDPKVQEWVFNQHIKDIDSFIDKQGLNKYEGQEIGGVPIDRSAMQAMAHLGGKGGLQKFLTTGGEYNPSDELGTSLTDYAKTHGGITGPRMSVPEEGSMDDDRKGYFKYEGKPRSQMLPGFAEELGLSSAMLSDMIGQVNDDLNKTLDFGAQMITQPPTAKLSFGDEIPAADPGSIVPSLGSPTQPDGRPSVTTAPQGFGLGSPTNTPAGAPPGFSLGQTGTPTPMGAPRMSSSGGGGVEAAAKGSGFMDNVLGKLFPGTDPENRSTKASDMLQALSIGLGQMSGGSNVDLSPVFDRMAGRQAAAADAVARQQDMMMQAQRINMEQKRFELDVAKASLDEIKFYSEQDGYRMPQTMLDRVTSDPAYTAIAPMLASPSAEMRKMGMEQYAEIAQKQAEAMIEATGGDKRMGDLHEAFLTGDKETANEILNSGNLTAPEINSIMKLAGVEPTAEMLNTQFYRDALETDPPLAAALERRAKINNPNAVMTPAEEVNLDHYRETRDAFSETANGRWVIQAALDNIERGTVEIMLDPDANDKGVLSKLYTKGYSGLKGTMPGVADFVADAFGLNVDAEQLVQSGASTLALHIARPLMQGQGTVTEGERKALLETIASGEMTPELRLEMVEQLRVLDALDAQAQARYTQLMRAQDDGSLPDSMDTLDQVREEIGSMSSELVRAAQASTALRHYDKSDVFKEELYGVEDDPLIAFDYAAPRLTPAQVAIARNMTGAIPAYRSGNTVKQIWIEVNPATGAETYMQSVNGVVSEVPVPDDR